MIRLFVVLHRWTGIVLCLFFAAWFASGIVMLYVPFPSLPAAERLARAPAVEPENLTEPVHGVLETIEAGDVDRVRLIAFGDRPVLVVESSGSRIETRFADSGEAMPPLTADQAGRIASQFSGNPVETVDGPFDYDQWVVHQQFDNYRPFYRVAVADNSGTQLYVSQATGEVLQRTRGRERAWNYAGAVVHWIYPTIIRKNWALWDQLVWWMSLIGIVGALLGMTLGIVRMRDAWRHGRRGVASPFVGLMRWHHQLGMIFGIIVIAWIFSGWLSMDHGRLFSVPDPTAEQVTRFRGITLPEAMARVSNERLQSIAGAGEIEISAIAGQPFLIIRDADGERSSLVGSQGDSVETVTVAHIERAVEAAWPDAGILESYAVTADDRYAHLREGSLGPTAMRTVLDDAGNTWIHVDTRNGRILSVMDRSRRVYRWLFNGLHSFDFPGFVDRRPLWDLTMISLLIAGFLFSITGTVIGYRRLRRRRIAATKT